jgi:hypothetical protein
MINECGTVGGMKIVRETEVFREATSCTTKPTSDLGSNPDRCSEKRATNRLSYGRGPTFSCTQLL